MDQERRGLRFQFDAAAEIAPESSPSATVAARVTELSPSGCYLETPAPFEVRTPVLVKIFHSAEYFEAKAIVIDVKPTVGGEMADVCEFSIPEEADEIFGLMIRHWNTIAGTLFKDEVYVPLLLEDESGVAHGNDWARGFMRGMHMRHDGWAELVNDEENGGCLIPMMMLCHEHDEDPKMRPKPITPEKREDIIVHMAEGLVGSYRYFREYQKTYAGSASAPESRRTTSKVGRNDPCPCGSGKKYKKCCGEQTVN